MREIDPIESLAADLAAAAWQVLQTSNAIDQERLKRCCERLLAALEVLGDVYSQRSRSDRALWAQLSAVEAACRVLSLYDRPMKPSDIFVELTKRGGISRATSTPIATLHADLEHARLFVRKCDWNHFDLTPAAHLLERARTIMQFDTRYPDAQAVMRRWALRHPPRPRRRRA
jgi:hypothetical protein